MTAISYLISVGGNLETVTAGTNAPAGVVATVTAGSAAIAAANEFSAGQPVQFAGSFGTVTGLSAATTYYVIATGLSSTQFEVAATPGASAITPGGTASAAVTVAALGAVEIRMDQTTTAVTDAAYAGGTRPLKRGEVQYLMRILEEFLVRDTNPFQ